MIDQSLPLISIGITCFNAVTTISRALDSALSQDWENLEILVVDDGSHDGSQAILQKRAAQDSRIRVIEHAQNKGCAAARNTILRESNGEFIAFFDDDDVSRKDRIRLQYKRITAYERLANTKMIACYASGQRIYNNGYEMPILAIGSKGPGPIGVELADYLLCARYRRGIFYGGGTPTCSLMARATTFQKIGEFDQNMRRQEDADFAIRLALNGGHFIGISESVLTQYASHSSDKTAQHEHESFLYLLEKNKKYLLSNGNYIYMRRWAELRFRHFSGRPVAASIILIQLLITYPFRTLRHFSRTALNRFIHERRMKA
ncbi:glycosyltransferase family 2 protein [Thalassospira sp. TSL5-1]|uniref:glycosyltransferase family 2 protein n=1 Tax=Thalassospira sp. TSL5-1 TaxID=1544451 RepID=UPI000938D5A7|nr:glycosyltransferase family 2 protein [Thalassospira sp. TSL5-1]OKH87450.1 glycosyl transferase [Thalassospira sp. TSL5-1]